MCSERVPVRTNESFARAVVRRDARLAEFDDGITGNKDRLTVCLLEFKKIRMCALPHFLKEFSHTFESCIAVHHDFLISFGAIHVVALAGVEWFALRS